MQDYTYGQLYTVQCLVLDGLLPLLATILRYTVRCFFVNLVSGLRVVCIIGHEFGYLCVYDETMDVPWVPVLCPTLPRSEVVYPRLCQSWAKEREVLRRFPVLPAEPAEGANGVVLDVSVPHEVAEPCEPLQEGCQSASVQLQ